MMSKLLISFVFTFQVVCGFYVSPKGSHRPSSKRSVSTRIAQELVISLVQEEKCFSTKAGAKAFGDACAFNIVYEDCFEAQPIVGKTVSVYCSAVWSISLPRCKKTKSLFTNDALLH